MLISTGSSVSTLRAAEPQTGGPQTVGVGVYTGPGSCAATACHGSIKAIGPVPQGVQIRQNEYSTWIAQDRHALATKVLENEVSQRIGRILKIDNPKTNPKCLTCHGLVVAKENQAQNFQNDGVSCEACHGPSGGWLGDHVTARWKTTPAGERSKRQMINTKDPVERTRRCLTCHVGTDEKDKFVDHEMIAAGHPDLVFELEFFSTNMPRHWLEAEKQTEDPFRPVRAFSLGQLIHARQEVDRLSRRAKSGIWPEYAELDCFACHHSLGPAEKSWRLVKPGYYDNRQPGNPAFNQSRWLTARHVVAVFNAPGSAALDAAMNDLATEASKLNPDRSKVETQAEQVKRLLDTATEATVRATAADAKPDPGQARRLLSAILGDVEQIAMRGERAAEQAYMAVDTLYSASTRGNVPPGVRAALDEVRQQLTTPSTYDPERFVADMKKIEGMIK
jgi:Cytochrome c554 and c-prime